MLHEVADSELGPRWDHHFGDGRTRFLWRADLMGKRCQVTLLSTQNVQFQMQDTSMHPLANEGLLSNSLGFFSGFFFAYSYHYTFRCVLYDTENFK